MGYGGAFPPVSTLHLPIAYPYAPSQSWCANLPEIVPGQARLLQTWCSEKLMGLEGQGVGCLGVTISFGAGMVAFTT